VCIADINLLKSRAQALGLSVNFKPFTTGQPIQPCAAGELYTIHLPLGAPVLPGLLNPANSPYVLATLNLAADLCSSGEAQALVTAPVQKSVINEAGIPFSGHTEFLAELTHTEHVVMMLAAADLRVALATTHLPLKDVAAAITPTSLTRTLTIMATDLRTKFGIEAPRITVLGLNPHAGESGHIGTEEQTIIEPVLEKLRAQGMTLTGPLPADTAFGNGVRAATDAYLAMYHDQGLPVLKYAGFGEAVNITLGLPINRTSVDHGTALSLAATGQANSGSMLAAISQAIDCCNRR
jgi:4-hydroxythreonine-4-phosphate dehydrogenase